MVSLFRRSINNHCSISIPLFTKILHYKVASYHDDRLFSCKCELDGYVWENLPQIPNVLPTCGCTSKCASKTHLNTWMYTSYYHLLLSCKTWWDEQNFVLHDKKLKRETGAWIWYNTMYVVKSSLEGHLFHPHLPVRFLFCRVARFFFFSPLFWVLTASGNLLLIPCDALVALHALPTRGERARTLTTRLHRRLS
jgi:hypothetical protein